MIFSVGLGNPTARGPWPGKGMVFNIFLHKTFMNILHLNLCGKYMPTAVWIRVN